ncbi:MAG TPA: MauE/DoxX family redox-associated membrane protein [Thermomonospora sp.]|nr:MauE/DoxX family redox-associated membrane protein [Thermomonospora sp.]
MSGVAVVSAQGALATVFGYAFYSKVRGGDRFRAFLTTVRKLMMRSGPLTVGVAVVFAAAEAVAAVLVALPWTSRVGFAVGTGLLVFFIGVVVRAVRGGVFAECRCFGDHSSVLGYPILVRNVLLLGVAVTGLVLAPGGGAGPVATVCAATAGAVGAAVFVRYYDDVVTAVLLRLYPSEADRQA